MNPKVYLVGAGPGDPELLTLKAARILGQAEVLLYDRLVSDAILELVSPQAHRIYVGKEMGEQDRVQEDIFTLMLAYAKSGQRVVRLKGGDPMVYGRGGEEWAFLAEHGIEVEMVPGISSALAAPTLAGIPLTLRGVANSFAIVSGQQGVRIAHNGDAANLGKGGAMPEFASVAKVDTLVVLMAVKERAEIADLLIKSGRKSTEPVAFIENSSTPQERVIVSSLAEVAAGGVEVASPAVWVLGEVVKVRSQISQPTLQVQQM
jgi:uroporphyrin-III C-methyltransferase